MDEIVREFLVATNLDQLDQDLVALESAPSSREERVAETPRGANHVPSAADSSPTGRTP